MPERVSAWAVYHQFRTFDDKTIFLGVTSDKQWLRFCKEFDRPDLAADARLTTNNARIAEREWLLPELRELLLRLTLADAVARCERADLPFSPVARPEDLFDDVQLRAGGSMLETTLPGGQTGALPALPLSLGDQRWGKRLDPPLLGEHTRDLLLAAGVPAGHIDELVSAGVIVTRDENERRVGAPRSA